MLSLLYVSESRIADFATDELSNIVANAVRRNLERNVTGALAHTGTHFAQVLEGPEPAVTEIMAGIRHDPRHRRIRWCAPRISPNGASRPGAWRWSMPVRM